MNTFMTFLFLSFSALIGSKYTHQFYKEKEIQRIKDKFNTLNIVKNIKLKGRIDSEDYMQIICQLNKL